MDFEEFRKIDVRFREKNPKIFQLSHPDAPASDDQIFTVEESIGVNMPECYRRFLKTFGGGNFGLTTIFSADPESEWYLPSRYADSRVYLPKNVVPISDDFSGGNYVLKVEQGKCGDLIFYWNQDGGLVETEFHDVLEFVSRYAYEPA